MSKRCGLDCEVYSRMRMWILPSRVQLEQGQIRRISST
jgi:hypothetical protein